MCIVDLIESQILPAIKCSRRWLSARMRRCVLPATQTRTLVGTETSSSTVAIPPSWPDELALATNATEAFRPRRRDALICSQASQSINVARLRPTGDKRGRTPAVRTFARHPLPCSRRRRPFCADCLSWRLQRCATHCCLYWQELRKTIN